MNGALPLAGGVLLALALGMLAARRTATQAQAATLQSLVLAGAALGQGWIGGQPVILLVALAALAGAAIPWAIPWPAPLSVTLAAAVGRRERHGMLLVGATLACLAIAVTLSSGGHDGIGVGLATVLVGMVAAARRGAVVQALGLLTMQNGMALVALGTERPWLAVAAATPLLPALVLLRRVAPR